MTITAMFLLASVVGDGNSNSLQSMLQSISMVVIHVLCVSLCTVAYRLSSFHPLHEFPGPFLGAATALYSAYVASTGKRHLVIQGLHAKYGKIVRTGPNSLSINAPNAIGKIYAQANCMNKSDAYLLGRSKHSGLFFIPDREEHNRRRDIWSSAFTPSAIDGHRATIERRGDIVFGGSNRLELMLEGDPHQYVKCGQIATAAFDVLGEVPWLFDLLWYLPLTQDIHALEQFAATLMSTRRRDSNGPHQDICSSLAVKLGEVDDGTSALSDGELNVDALFAIQAGSDSTASVLNFAFYYLLNDRSKYEKLQAELDDAFPTGSEITSSRLNGLPYLNAVVDEALRLGTPFSGLSRVVPEGGAMIDGHFIPGGTIVGVPAYTQQVSAENFSPEPEAFRPERWINDSTADSTATNSLLKSS
ncbi:cytochrome P450 [Punctularia strigosozonata HHB-11173 SS5]|uniref:cytochrome P450 n=1 Tax=Punctularia strigosozonata (strain HHB-11173) TaxID=741275 RepID=UPI0004417B39|nr:cytochrome P450 [Punctularia strigosozonata HHB-11173 SS5]EIN11087.1 cytochrome P450 [Punctularia strigosozonata HHB-11173 SS5]